MAKPAGTRVQTKGKPVPAPLIGSFLLESITTGMYGERKNAIREYVQNSFDGVQSAIAAGVLRRGSGRVSLTLSPDKKNLVILDNGIGLPQRIAVNTLTAVGASRKERAQQAGFRGIGRLAGTAFTKLLRFRTKAAGDLLETIVEFDCEELRRGMLSSGRRPAAELITACTTFEQPRADDANAHYFEVSLIGLQNAPAEATDPVQMKTFLAQIAPVDFHPDFKRFKDQIMADADALGIPLTDDEEEAEEEPDELEEPADWTVLDDEASTMLERVPVPHVSVVVRSGPQARDEPIYKPYRLKLGLDESDDVALDSVAVHSGASGAWWGWVGYKTKPGEYQNKAVAGIRFRLKNIQIDGNELITLVPTTNKIRDPFSRWSGWFIGEIYLDSRAVVPNARRDNFEEDPRWLAIRDEISTICADLTTEARRVSKDHQNSLTVIETKTAKLRSDYLNVVRAKTFDVVKAQKLLAESDKLQKSIEKAANGAPAVELLRLKSISKELTQVRVGLLEKPRTPEYEQFRDAIRQEFMKKTLEVLNEYLEIDDYEAVKVALERSLR